MSLAGRFSLKRRAALFPGWWVVVAGFGLQTLIAVLLQQSFGAYFVPLQEQFKWNLTLLSGAYALSQVVSGVIGPLQGWLIDRFGVRSIVRIGLLIFGAGLVLFGLVANAVTLYIAVFIASVGMTLAGWVTVNVAVALWFRRRRSAAIGIASMGYAVGGLLVPVITLAISEFGWRPTAMASAAVTLVIGLPLAQWMRSKPEDYGLLPDGRIPQATFASADTAGRDQSAVRDEPEVDFTPREALRTWAFWQMGLGQAFAVFVVSSASVHMIPHLVDRLDMSLEMAGTFLGLMIGVSIVGQLFGGLIGDRADKRMLCIVAMVGHGVGVLALAYAMNGWWVVAFAVLHGIAWGVRSPIITALRADYFGRRHFGSIMGISMFIMLIGSVGGPMLAGYLADLTGDFRLGFTVLAALSFVGILFFVGMRQPAPPRRVASPTHAAQPPA